MNLACCYQGQQSTASVTCAFRHQFARLTPRLYAHIIITVGVKVVIVLAVAVYVVGAVQPSGSGFNTLKRGR